jgi:hypothetical protein
MGAERAPAVAPRRSGGYAFNAILRGLGVIASCVPLVIGLVACARIDWSVNGFDSPAVRVWHMTFTPWIAVGTAIAGVVGVAAAASAFRAPKLVVGAIFACAGVVVMIAQPSVDHVEVVYRYGVIALVVGVVLFVTGALMRSAGPAVTATSGRAMVA